MMENQFGNQDIEISVYARAIIQKIWLVLLLAIIAGAGMYLYLSAQQPRYRASSILLVVSGSGETARAQLTDIQVGERLALSYVERLSNREILAEAIEKLGLDKTVGQLRLQLDISVVGRTQLIRLVVEDTDPKTARDLANEIPSVFADRNAAQQAERFSGSRASLEEELAEISMEIDELTLTLYGLENDPSASQAEILRVNDNLERLRETYSRLLQSFEDLRIAETNQQSNIIVDEAAVVPQFPVWPNVRINTILAAILGALGGIVIIIIIEFFDNSVKSAEDVRRATDLPTLSAIASYSMKKGQDYELITQVEPRSPVSEAYRGLRTAIMFSNVDKVIKSMLITSSNPGEGKSITTANIGVVMAQAGNRVLILDADLRKPMQHNIFKIKSNNMGLTHVLLRMLPSDNKIDSSQDLSSILKSVIHETGQPRLFLLNSGSIPPNPAELIGSEKMKKLINVVAKNFDMVLIDSPPTLAVTDAVVMATRVDDVMLVCRSGVTRRNQLQQAVARLQDVKANVIGVVLNRAQSKGGDYYHTYYANSESNGKGKSTSDEAWVTN